MNGWPSKPEAVDETIKCVLRYCLSAEAITACIAHFSAEVKWVPTEYDIRLAAHERAWGSSPLTLLRKQAQSCPFCEGIGREYVKIKRRNRTTGELEEVDALDFCRCPYGQLRAKVERGAVS